MFVPSFQGALAWFEQSLIFATDHRFETELLAHAVLLQQMLVHFVRQDSQVESFKMLVSEDNLPGH